MCSDGFADGKRVHFINKSEILIRQIQLLLLEFGIKSGYHRVDMQDGRYWFLLQISSSEGLRRFIRSVYVFDDRKRKSLLKFSGVRMSQKKYARVERVVPIGEREVFDLEVNSAQHLFYANGIAVHNCTEEQIIQASRYFMEAGYKKIKYFMISNLPMDTEEDTCDVMNWIPKVVAIKKELGAKTQLSLSYTPLTIHGHTPMQWYECTPQKRSLDKVIEWGMPYPDVQIKLGNKSIANMTLQQLLFMGDRRLFPVWIELVRDQAFYWSGNISKGYFAWVEEKLKSIYLPFEFWFRAKGRDEVLPWDWIDSGVTKDQLWVMKERGEKYEHSPKCSESCEFSTCKNCTPEDLLIRKERLSVKDPDVDLETVKPKDPTIVQRARMQIYIPGRNRFIDNKIMKFIFRRACYQAGLPIERYKIYQASDSVKVKNWVEGIDYMDCSFIEELKMTPQEFIATLQPYCTHFEIKDVRFYRPELLGLNTMVDCAYYTMIIDEPMDAIKGSIDSWMALPPIEIPEEMEADVKRKFYSEHKQVVRITVEGFAGPESYLVDARSKVFAAGIHPKTGRVWLETEANLSPILVAQRMFQLGYAALRTLKVIREDYYIKPPSDLFTTSCSVCGETVEQDMYGIDVHPNLCLEHLNK